jgi:PAS domain S-box-containing protein
MNPRPPPFTSLRARLLIGSGIPLTLFVGVALIALTVLYRLLDAMGQERHSHQAVVAALKQQDQLHRMLLTVQYGHAADFAALQKNYGASRGDFLRANDEAQQLARENGKQLGRLREVRESEDEWRRLVEDSPTPPPGFQDRSQQLADRIEGRLEDFIGDEEAVLSARREQAERQAWQGGAVIAGALVAATAASLLLAWRVSRSVTRPIDRLRKAAAQLLAGRFEMERPAGPDEIAQLIVDFNHIGLSLAQRVSSLQEQEEGYRQYIGAVSQLMWRTDATGAVAADLPAWRGFTGQTADQILRAGWLDAVHPEDRPRLAERWRSAVRSRRLYEEECRLRSAAGEYRTFACRGVPILNADGSVREWIGTCADITGQKERERLRQEKEAAQAASRAKSDFLARVSHELRTPLNAVIGMSRLLATQRFGLLNAKQADYVNDVTRAGERLLTLINDVLDVAQLETGRMEIRPEGFDPSDAIRAVVETLRPTAAQKALDVGFDRPPPGEVAADPLRFKQVLYNLLSNAVKFTPAGGQVAIQCQWVGRAERDATAALPEEAAAVRVEVADTGCGIAAEDQERIWDEFRRLPSAADDGAPAGVGLGLAVSRRLVRRMGGAIWVRSAVGRGSTFGFVLPRRQPDERPAAATCKVE